jgi:predicted nucleic acid-binding protein
VTRAVVDTSVVIAAGGSRAEIDLPPKPAISVVTFGELRAGIHMARTQVQREVRARRFEVLQSKFEALPVDFEIACHFGESLAWARTHARGTKATDLLIIATAKALHLPLFTLDQAQAAVATAVGVDLFKAQ